MRKAVITLLCALFLTAEVLPVYAVNVSDANRGNAEWAGAEYIVFDMSASHNNTSGADVKILPSRAENSVFLGFSFKTTGVSSGESRRIGIHLENDDINLDFQLYGKADGDGSAAGDFVSETLLNDSGYYVFASMQLQPDNTTYCEMEINYKKGLPDETHYSVQFYDADGILSSAEKITVSTVPETTAESTVTGTAGQSKTKKAVTSAKEKTTKQKTASSAPSTAKTTESTLTVTKKVHRVDTTRETTEKRTTEKETTAVSSSAKEKNTAAKQPETASGSTAAKTETEAPASKTVKASKKADGKKADGKDKKNSGTALLPADETETESVPEPETVVVISEVYVTGTEPSTDGSLFGASGISKSTAYKAVIGAAALILLVITGVWAVKSKE